MRPSVAKRSRGRLTDTRVSSEVKFPASPKRSIVKRVEASTVAAAVAVAVCVMTAASTPNPYNHAMAIAEMRWRDDDIFSLQVEFKTREG